MKKYYGVLMLIGLFMASCSSTPGVSDVKKDVLKQIEENGNGLIELKSINKTNSLTENMFGKEVYVVEFEAKIKILEDCNFSQAYYSAVRKVDPYLQFMPGSGKRYSKGDVVSVDDKMRFEKTENGWRKFGN